ncbi:hypothetical protein SOVF_030570 [Spinacia oleracea]|nr:hypothetical protein SOVF_030570 [Spinacia oleracea]
MPLHTRRKLAERSTVRAAMEDASDNEAAATDVPTPGMVPRAIPTFEGTGWQPSDLVFRPEFHLSQRPRAGLIWAYEHFPSLAPARPRGAAYPFAASWEGAVRNDVSLATFRRALRVLPVGQKIGGRKMDLSRLSLQISEIEGKTRLDEGQASTDGETRIFWLNFVSLVLLN